AYRQAAGALEEQSPSREALLPARIVRQGGPAGHYRLRIGCEHSGGALRNRRALSFDTPAGLGSRRGFRAARGHLHVAAEVGTFTNCKIFCRDVAIDARM